MNDTGYELLWLLLVYSFLGWVLESVNGAIRQKRFVNRGLVNSPFCLIYGITAVAIAVFGQELSGIWLFIGSAVLATVVEWIGGHLLEWLCKERWWDYSSCKMEPGRLYLPSDLVAVGILGICYPEMGESYSGNGLSSHASQSGKDCSILKHCLPRCLQIFWQPWWFSAEKARESSGGNRWIPGLRH